MFDFIGLRISFKDAYVKYSWLDDRLLGSVDLEECGKRGVNIVPREMTWEIDGLHQCHNLYCPWDSLPSSFTGVAFKVFQGGGFNVLPYLEIKASPAKLAQGHNVYGSESLELGVRLMYQTLKATMPEFADMLDFPSAHVFRLDSTYSVRLPDEDALASALRALANVSNRYLRPSRDMDFESTIYFNKAKDKPGTGRVSQTVIYSKKDEVEHQLNDLRKKAHKERTHRYDPVIEALSSPDLQNFALYLLRMETRCKTWFFQRRNVPISVTGMLDYIRGFEQEHGSGSFCRWLWREATFDLIDAISGQQLEVIHDGKIRRLLHATYDTERNGKKSTAKSLRLFGFYRRLVHEGYSEVKRTMGRSSFYNAVNDVMAIGLSKAELQNLHKGQKKPLLNLIKVDFDAQRPASYQEPVMPAPELTFTEFLASLDTSAPVQTENAPLPAWVTPDMRLIHDLNELGVSAECVAGLKAGRKVRMSEDKELSLAFWRDGSFNLVVNSVNGDF
ncbi:phage/plasmid replication protein, II/X family [Citrobacter meridianamericanus]|uniref:phage/plasmid replication protein, II/X family n=1 Tax=Citrobacter meridianamericanus TaxID=2894201 RepID=UPI00351D623E